MFFPSAYGTSTANVVGTVATNIPLIKRNLFINGGFQVDQRNAGASQVITAAAAKAYTVDRWYAYCEGANVTGEQVAGSGQDEYRYQFTGAESNTAIQFGQRIEASHCYFLNGQTVTLSIDLANSLLTTVTWTAYYANTTDTFGTIASPTRTQIDTGTFPVTSTLTRYSTQIDIPVAATTGIEIVFSVSNQTSGTWTIGAAQLEVGTVATPFEYRDFAEELLACQRYGNKSYNYQDALGSITDIGCYLTRTPVIGTTNTTLNVRFPVTMRASPTITLYSPSTGASGFLRDTTDSIDRAAIAADVGDSGFAPQSVAGISGENVVRVHYFAESEI